MPNIIETAIAANNFQTLVAAIKAADLVEKFAELAGKARKAA